MTLTESIVEDAALEWFGEQTRYARTLTPALSQGERETVGHGAAFAGLRRAKPSLAPGEYADGTLTPALSHGEREEDGAVVQSCVAQTLTRPLPRGEEDDREAIRRLNPANAFGNPHPTSPKGRGVEASASAAHAVRRATGKRSLQVQIERSPNP